MIYVRAAQGDALNIAVAVRAKRVNGSKNLNQVAGGLQRRDGEDQQKGPCSNTDKQAQQRAINDPKTSKKREHHAYF